MRKLHMVQIAIPIKSEEKKENLLKFIDRGAFSVNARIVLSDPIFQETLQLSTGTWRIRRPTSNGPRYYLPALLLIFSLRSKVLSLLLAYAHV